ncbi:MAG: IclR family transcriptional regulator [Haloferacaceae archaeon]
MTDGETPGRRLKTLETAADVVDAIQRLDGADVATIADRCDLGRSTVHGYVTTLERLGYLVRDGTQYHVGLEFLAKGGHARTRKSEYEYVGEKVADLAERTGERAQFIVEENGRGYYVHTTTGENAVRADAALGKKIHLHASSAGKALLAALPRDRVDEIVERWGLPRYTDRTITTREDLHAELDAVRDRGYATSDEESIEGLRAVGVAVTVDGTTLGAISLSGPVHRMKGEWFDREVPDRVLGVVNEIELDLKYQ